MSRVKRKNWQCRVVSPDGEILLNQIVEGSTKDRMISTLFMKYGPDYDITVRTPLERYITKKTVTWTVKDMDIGVKNQFAGLCKSRGVHINDMLTSVLEDFIKNGYKV